MKKDIHKWKSCNLEKDMPLAIYGHYGYALIMFPAISDGYLEYENKGLIDAISPNIVKGKCKVFTISGFLEDSWLNETKFPEEKSKQHYLYNTYLEEELIPFIFNNCGGPVPIITCGASRGAYLAVNAYLRRPDIFYGAIAMSGFYDICNLTYDYFDDNCYFNSPVHYIPNLADPYWLSFLKGKHHLYLISGTGEGDNPVATSHFGNILKAKDIPHEVDIWGTEYGHNWEAWNKILPQILDNKF